MDLHDLSLSSNQKKALYRIKEKLTAQFSISQTVIFGSVVRDKADPESDLDVLVLTKNSLSHREKHEIYAMVTEVNLEHDTNLSVLVVEEKEWENGLCSVLPIKEEVQQEGIRF